MYGPALRLTIKSSYLGNRHSTENRFHSSEIPNYNMLFSALVITAVHTTLPYPMPFPISRIYDNLE